MCTLLLHSSFGNAEGLTFSQEIACFSYDDEHRFHLDDSSLRYYYPPHLPADLNRGFDTFQQLDDSGDEHLDALLETIIALEKSTGTKCEADIITWRGMMTKVRKHGASEKACVYQRRLIAADRSWPLLSTL